MTSHLSLRGARENNLKSVDLDIPHDSLTVVTGLSGSGKSSLAFDTVYAEGQRRYIETFSPYTRQFFDKVKKPDCDSAEFVRPAVAIQQRTRVLNSRSTVGTMTDVNDYLKVLWYHLSKPHCPHCSRALQLWTVSAVTNLLQSVASTHQEFQFLITAPFRFENKKRALEEVERLIALGYHRALLSSEGRVDSSNGTLDSITMLENVREAPPLTLSLVLDRVTAKALSARRIIEAVEQAFSLAGGACQVFTRNATDEGARYHPLKHDGISDGLFSQRLRCCDRELTLPRLRPALFSFNSPIGACPACKGFGKVLAIDRALVVPNHRLSVIEDAVECWRGDAARGEKRRLLAFCRDQGIPTDAPWSSLTKSQHELIFTHKGRDFTGIEPWFKRIERKAYKMHVRVFLARYRTQIECPDCGGERLTDAALAFRVDGRPITALWRIPIEELRTWLEESAKRFLVRGRKSNRELSDVFAAALTRVQYLCDLGLGYLTLDRQARTLSGGETQRVNLATALGSDLVSTQFVLDEPSVGLHPRDTERLERALRNLTDKGNSLLVVEHDFDIIKGADHIIEIGPKAGEDGGRVVFQGPAREWSGIEVPHLELDARATREELLSRPKITVEEASERNLKGFTLDVPLRSFVVVTGVSGSGKSTLVHEAIARRYEADRNGLTSPLPPLRGTQHVTELVVIDQSALAKSPRANIATYSGIWDHIRELLARTGDASARGFTASAFSFNVDAGRCSACSGAGFIREDMQFLSDVFIPCEICLGKRFTAPVLEVRYRDCSVDSFLSMTVSRCASFFSEAENPSSAKRYQQIASIARTLEKLGLGHLTLGHSLSELSGGEAQRLKLTSYIAETKGSSALMIFDEPTTGLHAHDVMKLVELLRMLVARGHSVLCVEHNLLLISEADWIIDLGPDGGARGGEVLATGTVSEFLSPKITKRSLTATALSSFISEDRSTRAKRVPKKRAVAKPRRRVIDVNSLTIEGAREHNLKNISVEIPLRRVVTLTGVSGSGKSTIAKDIVYAEGQRRYLDCLSPYARQFIHELKKPDIDAIRNVQPTVCVYQHTFQPSQLSTVGTMSEVYNYLRLLYAKVGLQHCPEHPEEIIAALSPSAIAGSLKRYGDTSIRLLAPIVKLKKGHHKAVFERASSQELHEVRVDGTFASPQRFTEGLARSKAHTIEFVVARCRPGALDLEMLEEAVEQALALSGGTLIVHDGKSDLILSQSRTCPQCQRGFFKPDPEDFSFHSRRGRCELCDGTGLGARGAVCKGCGGTRLGEVGRSVTIGGRRIGEAMHATPQELREWVAALELPRHQAALAQPICDDLVARLETLEKFGLDYLKLDRECRSLSSGELQRLRLAAAMGTPLSGAMYIFDEPSAGLHPHDNRRIVERFGELRDKGNSVLIIEHDASTILQSDYIIEVGPGAGSNGGEIVATGTPQALLRGTSLSAAWLQTPYITPRPPASVETPQSDWLRVTTKPFRNLIQSDYAIPLNALVVVAGVSGAGKSSLVHGVIGDAMQSGLAKGSQEWRTAHAKVISDIPLERVLVVDQSPIGANSRSTPASYLGIWDNIRTLLSQSLEAKARGLTSSFFSYNTGKGRCPACSGLGVLKLEMSFLPRAEVPCETCGGKRFSEDACQITYRGHSVADMLRLTFEEAKSLFAHHERIHRSLHRACELGLGYLQLGQSSATLSGGESQRIKLVSELSQRRMTPTLYILDEPTTGLHRADVAQLIMILKELVALGHSVLVIEHDADILLQADWILELGPGPAERGGRVIFEGHPSKLLTQNTPWGKVVGEGVRIPSQKRSSGRGSQQVVLT